VSAVIGQKKTTCFKRGGAEHTDANEITWHRVESRRHTCRRSGSTVGWHVSRFHGNRVGPGYRWYKFIGSLVVSRRDFSDVLVTLWKSFKFWVLKPFVEPYWTRFETSFRSMARIYSNIALLERNDIRNHW
jgi:hypothetical protein